jgi:hypothetical protein
MKEYFAILIFSLLISVSFAQNSFTAKEPVLISGTGGDNNTYITMLTSGTISIKTSNGVQMSLNGSTFPTTGYGLKSDGNFKIEFFKKKVKFSKGGKIEGIGGDGKTYTSNFSDSGTITIVDNGNGISFKIDGEIFPSAGWGLNYNQWFIQIIE